MQLPGTTAATGALENLFTLSALPQYAQAAPVAAAFHGIVYITGGEGCLQVDGVTHAFEEAELLLIARGQVYTLDSSNAAGYLLWFDDSFWLNTPNSARDCKTSLFGSIQQHQHLRPSPEAAAAVNELLQVMLAECVGPGYSNKPDVLAAYLKILVIKIANIPSLLSAETNNYHYQVYQQFINLVHRHYTQWHEVAAYADSLGVSTRKLGEICKTFQGKGAKELIIHQLLESSRRLLQFSNRPVKEIAFSQGFSTAYQFSAFFKKHTGESPFAYRSRFAAIGN